jgi:fatty-acyl-CoA synthase
MRWTNQDALAYHARVRPGRRACLDLRSGRSFSYAELDDLTARCAGLLQEQLAEPFGARVATLLRNSVDALALMYACERVGAIYTPLNWRLTPAELRVLASDCEPSLLVVDTEFSEVAGEAFPDTVTLFVDADDNRFRSAVLAAEPAAARPGPSDHPCIMLYTSGTTGRPKGVVLTRANVFWAGFNFASVGEVGPQSAMLCDPPMFHTVGLIGTCRCVLQQGGAVLLSDAFQPARALERLSDPALGVTHYFGVPQIAQMLCDDPTYQVADLSRLRALVVGGAPLPTPLCERLLADGVLIVNGYGMTETSTITGMPLDPGTIRARPQSAGLPGPAVEVRIVATDGREAGPDEVGEVWVRGPAVTQGYWRQPDATAAAFTDGWFRTGDAGQLDAAGYLTIVDRWKDMYISGGENVYPAEVEAVIVALPGVREVAVVGLPDARWGEIGCAFVVCDPGAAPGEADVAAHCRARLARYKQPAMIRFIDALPRTASGKVRKDQLRRQGAAEPAS